MFELKSGLIIGWLILSSIMFTLAVIFNSVKIIRGFFWRGLTGISVILVVNYIFSGYNIALGINIFTAFISGILGIPGVAMMFCLNYFIV